MNLKIKSQRVDVPLLCETNLNKNTTQLVRILGFDLILNQQEISKGGGTATLVGENINYTRRRDLEDFTEREIESTYIELRANNGKIFVV